MSWIQMTGQECKTLVKLDAIIEIFLKIGCEQNLQSLSKTFCLYAQRKGGHCSDMSKQIPLTFFGFVSHSIKEVIIPIIQMGEILRCKRLDQCTRKGRAEPGLESKCFESQSMNSPVGYSSSSIYDLLLLQAVYKLSHLCPWDNFYSIGIVPMILKCRGLHCPLSYVSRTHKGKKNICHSTPMNKCTRCKETCLKLKLVDANIYVYWKSQERPMIELPVYGNTSRPWFSCTESLLKNLCCHCPLPKHSDSGLDD